MNHTPESLLALTKSPEGLEQLRIIAAKADKRCTNYEVTAFVEFGTSRRLSHCRNCGCEKENHKTIPNYPASLDAIFAAEDRLRIHDVHSQLNSEWKKHLTRVSEITDIGFLSFTPLLRLIPFILTAQWKEQNL